MKTEDEDLDFIRRSTILILPNYAIIFVTPESSASSRPQEGFGLVRASGGGRWWELGVCLIIFLVLTTIILIIAILLSFLQGEGLSLGLLLVRQD